MEVLTRALHLDPDSYEANAAAARSTIGQGRIGEALQYLEKAAAVQPTDFWATGMSISGNHQLGNMEGALCGS